MVARALGLWVVGVALGLVFGLLTGWPPSPRPKTILGGASAPIASEVAAVARSRRLHATIATPAFAAWRAARDAKDQQLVRVRWREALLSLQDVREPLVAMKAWNSGCGSLCFWVPPPGLDALDDDAAPLLEELLAAESAWLPDGTASISSSTRLGAVDLERDPVIPERGLVLGEPVESALRKLGRSDQSTGGIRWSSDPARLTGIILFLSPETLSGGTVGPFRGRAWSLLGHDATRTDVVMLFGPPTHREPWTDSSMIERLVYDRGPWSVDFVFVGRDYGRLASVEVDLVAR